jgi:hypothetical protein
MCSYSKASHGFLSRVHKPSLKIKRSRTDSNPPSLKKKKTYKYPPSSMYEGLEKKKRRGGKEKK